MLYRLSIGIFEQVIVMAALRCSLQHRSDKLPRRRDPHELSGGCDFFLDSRKRIPSEALVRARHLADRAALLSRGSRFIHGLGHLSGAVVYRGNPPWWASVGWVLPLNPNPSCSSYSSSRFPPSAELPEDCPQ